MHLVPQRPQGRFIKPDRSLIPGKWVSISFHVEGDTLLSHIGGDSFPDWFWFLSPVSTLAFGEEWGEMESVEREMERVAFICLRPSNYSEEPFSRDKPSSPFRVPFHPEPYCHHDSHPGIPLFSSMENEVCGFENLSLSSPHFRSLWYGRMRRDDCLLYTSPSPRDCS